MNIRVVSFLLVLFLIACRHEVIDLGDSSHIKDGKYDSEFPSKPVSDHLKTILKSVHLVSVLTFYKSYYFSENEAITRDMLFAGGIDLASHDAVIFEQPASGTATLFYNDQKKIAFLTCAHIVQAPDTVITYYKNKNGDRLPFIKHYIKKVRQTGNIINQPIAYDFKIIAIDEDLDLAIIAKDLGPGDIGKLRMDPLNKFDESISVLTMPRGKAEELDWGTFVYVIGFPRAKKMVSSALVSEPNYDQAHSFLLNGSTQKGISGGIVIALRDDVPNFEMVGMAKGISGRVQYSLVPDPQIRRHEWEMQGLYDGQIHIEKQEIAEPGMIYVISIETILSFLDKNSALLREKGYSPDLFFR